MHTNLLETPLSTTGTGKTSHMYINVLINNKVKIKNLIKLRSLTHTQSLIFRRVHRILVRGAIFSREAQRNVAPLGGFMSPPGV